MSTNFLARVTRKTFSFILISTLLIFLIVTIHASKALSLDTTFGGDGKVTVSFSAGNDVGSGIAVQSDDKIVVAGTSDNGSGTSELAVARFNVDGSLDPTFSGDGKVTVSFSVGNDVGSGIAVQSDDKIVVMGTSNNGSGVSQFAVARFNINGSLDTAFSGDGKVTTSFFAGSDVGSGIAVQFDNKLGIIGTSDDLGTTWFAVGRFNLDGSFDTTFSGDGKVLTKFSLSGEDIGSGISVQSDDKIVVVGAADDESGALKFAVARFNVDGSFASTDSSTGKVTTSFSTGDDVGSGIAVQSDDKIVVVGTSDNESGTSEFAVARYLLDLTSAAEGDGGGGDGGGGGGGGCLISAAAYGFRIQKESLSLALLFGFLLIGFLGFGKKFKKQ